MSFSFFVGVDISKDSFSVCIRNAQGEVISQKSFPQSSQGFSSLFETLSSLSNNLSSFLVGMESTSIYHINLFSFLSEKGIPSVIINPSIIDRFSKVNLRPSKSDKKDAKTISEFLFIYKPSPSSSNKISELKIITRERENISKEISHLKDDIKRCLSVLFPELEYHVNPFTSGMLNFLLHFPSAKSIASSERKIVDFVFSESFKGRGKKPSFSSDMIFDLASKSIGINSKAFENILRSKIEILLLLLEELDKFDKLLSESIKDIEINDINIITSIPGIGKTSAISFLCEVQDIRRFRRAKSLIAYAGIEPVIKESGRRDVRLGISKKGNRHLRRILFLMAMNVIKYEGKFKEFFLKLRARGKSFKSALIAVANKLLRTIYSMLIHGTFYSPNYS